VELVEIPARGGIARNRVAQFQISRLARGSAAGGHADRCPGFGQPPEQQIAPWPARQSHAHHRLAPRTGPGLDPCSGNTAALLDRGTVPAVGDVEGGRKGLGRHRPAAFTPAVQSEALDQTRAVNGHRQRLAPVRVGEQACLAAHHQTEQSKRGIDLDRPARKRPCLGLGKVDDAPANHQIDIAARKGRHRLFGRECAYRDRPCHILPVLARRQTAGFGRQGGEPCSAGAVTARHPHRSRTAALPDQPHLGLSKQAQEIGHRRGKPDLDHPPGHCADFAHRGKIEAQRGSAHPGDRLTQPLAHVGSGDCIAVGQGAVTQAEDVTQPVIGDDPAFCDGGDDLSCLIERDQPFGGCAAHVLRGRCQAHTLLEQAFGRADDRDLDRPSASGRSAGRQRQCSKQGQPESHRVLPSSLQRRGQLGGVRGGG